MTILKILASLVTLCIVLKSISLHELKDRFSQLEFLPAILALLVFWMGQVVSSIRFYYVAAGIGSYVPLTTSIKVHFIGLWFNQVLPSGIGGDVLKVILVKPHMSLSEAFRTTVLDRAAGVIFLFGALLLQTPLYFSIFPSRAVWIQSIALAIALGAIGMLMVLGPDLRRVFARISLLRELFFVFESMRQFLERKNFWRQFWTSGVVHFVGIASYALLGIAVGAPVTFLQYVLVVPLVFLIALAPISFAGWGVREAGAVFLFGYVGVPSDQAVAISISFGLLLIVASLPGVAVILLSKRSSVRQQMI